MSYTGCLILRHWGWGAGNHFLDYLVYKPSDNNKIMFDCHHVLVKSTGDIYNFHDGSIPFR